MHYDPDVIIQARVLDISIGSIIGLIGGAMIYWNGLRRVLEKIAYKIFLKW